MKMELDIAVLIMEKVVKEHCITAGVEAWQTIRKKLAEAQKQSALPTNKQSLKYFEECGEGVDSQAGCDKCFFDGIQDCPRSMQL